MKPATKPTLYFIGVTTGSSSIMKIFPKWAERLGLSDASIVGIDLPIRAPAEEYREAVNFIKNDPHSLGALVTTHKIDLYNACSDLFDYIDPFALELSEVSCLSKNNGKFCAHAKDPISSGLALERFVPENYWSKNGGEVFLIGAGGSALAMSLYLGQEKWGGNVPKRVYMSNRGLPRLESAKQHLKSVSERISLNLVHCPQPEDNDKIVSKLPPCSLVVNATGLGKDAPGSPLTGVAVFPERGLVWEINYRGDLLFMRQALAQREARSLHVEDGFDYFIHGWTQVISEVFKIPIEGETLRRLGEIAKNT